MSSLKGNLLIANGSLFGPVFRQTVILLAEHGPDGALGFVVNRPTELVIDGEVGLPPAVLPDARVFYGGPVQEDVVAVIAEFAVTELVERPIVGALGWVSPEHFDDPAIARARVFAGYSGWGPGQLEAEMAEGSWLVDAATSDLLFDVPPEDLWPEVLRRKGGRYQLMATMPFDPTVN